MKLFPSVLALPLATIIASCCDEENINLHLIGDSTMADYQENTTQIRGWGEMLSQFVPDGVTVNNYARPGRSSRSFYEEGSWENVLNNIQDGDYVLIQFAHNDERDKGLDSEDGRGTAPWSTYRSFLKKYIDESRAKGAHPILVQPIIRRYFDGNSLTAKGCHNLSPTPDDSSLNYTAAMASVAKSENVPIIDLCSQTKQIVEAFGPIDSKKQLFVYADNTHTQAKGAALFALAVAESLDTMNIWNGSTQYPRIATNPQNISFNDVFIGDTVWTCFDAIDFYGISPQNRRVLTHSAPITIEAPKGLKLSSKRNGELKDSLIINNDEGASVFAVYIPKSETKFASSINLRTDNGSASIKVEGNGKRIKETKLAEAAWQNPSSYPTLKNIDLKLTHLKGLTIQNDDLLIDGNIWPAEIDEDGNRFIQFKISTEDKIVFLKNISLSTSGNMCYRMSYAYGNDFFYRTIIGERTKESLSPLSNDSFTTSIRIKPGEDVLIRIYPWSRTTTQNQPFKLQNLKFDGIAIE